MMAYPTIVRPFGPAGGLVEPPAPPVMETSLLDTFGVDGYLLGSPPDTTGLDAWAVLDNYGYSGDMLLKSGGKVASIHVGATAVGHVRALGALTRARAALSIGSATSTRRAIGLMWGADPARTLATITRGCWLAWLWRGEGYNGLRVFYSPDLASGLTQVAYYAVPAGLTAGEYDVDVDWSGGSTTIRLDGAPIIEGLAMPSTHLDYAGLAYSVVGAGAQPYANYIQGWSL